VGRFINNDGLLYEGQVKNGLKSGKGVLMSLLNYRYVGYFLNDQKHTLENQIGKEDFPNNEATYEGEFKFDKHHGFGKLTVQDGSCYEGEFFEGRFDGKGKFIYGNGEEYEGEWSEDRKHGRGRYVYEDGRVYEGDFTNDLPHG